MKKKIERLVCMIAVSHFKAETIRVQEGRPPIRIVYVRIFYDWQLILLLVIFNEKISVVQKNLSTTRFKSDVLVMIM